MADNEAASVYIDVRGRLDKLDADFSQGLEHALPNSRVCGQLDFGLPSNGAIPTLFEHFGSHCERRAQVHGSC